jgi:hypothetical protein
VGRDRKMPSFACQRNAIIELSRLVTMTLRHPTNVLETAQHDLHLGFQSFLNLKVLITRVRELDLRDLLRNEGICCTQISAHTICAKPFRSQSTLAQGYI